MSSTMCTMTAFILEWLMLSFSVLIIVFWRWSNTVGMVYITIFFMILVTTQSFKIFMS